MVICILIMLVLPGQDEKAKPLQIVAVKAAVDGIEKQHVSVIVERRPAILEHPRLARLAKDAIEHAAYAPLGVLDRPPDHC